MIQSSDSLSPAAERLHQINRMSYYSATGGRCPANSTRTTERDNSKQHARVVCVRHTGLFSTLNNQDVYV